MNETTGSKYPGPVEGSLIEPPVFRSEDDKRIAAIRAHVEHGGTPSPDSISFLLTKLGEYQIGSLLIVCAWCGKTNQRLADAETTNAMIREHILTECPNSGLGALVGVLSEFLRCFALIRDGEEPKAAELASAALGIYYAAEDRLPKPRPPQPPPIGDRVAWATAGGDRHEGEVIEIDNEDMVVRCDDGIERTVPWE